MTLPYRVHNVVSIDISLVKGIGAHKTTARLIPVPEVVTRARASDLSGKAAAGEGRASGARGRGLSACCRADEGDEKEKKEKKNAFSVPPRASMVDRARLMSIARPR